MKPTVVKGAAWAEQLGDLVGVLAGVLAGLVVAIAKVSQISET